MSRRPHRCPVVIVDGFDMSRLEDFADYMPEGVTLLPSDTYNGKMSTRHGCLCGVDMIATSAANGYVATETSPDHYTLALADA
jgi:hypothetical protein